MKTYENVVGIDLGTTNTLACWQKGGKLALVKFPGSHNMLPSALYVDTDGKQYVGQGAKSRGKADPGNMIGSSKTKMGKTREEASWECNGKTYGATDVATEILKEVRRQFIKQARLAGDAEIGAVITVPAYFNSNQKDETRKAAEAAGFHLIQLITEPMAAAVAAMNELDLPNRKSLVFDLGGGTFDLCVLEADQENHFYNTVEIDGDSELGGDDFDKLICEWLKRLVAEDTGGNFSSPATAGMDETSYNLFLAKLREIAEMAKCELSDSHESKISVPDLLPGFDLDIKLSRDEFNEYCKPLYDRIFTRAERFLKAHPEKFTQDDIGEIILAGGSCHIPYIEEKVADIFGRQPRSDLDKSLLVVKGAALVAQWLNSGMETRTTEILSHSLGLSVYEKGKDVFHILLPKSTPYPAKRKKTFTTAADNQESIVLKIYEAGHDREDSVDLADHDFYGSMLLDGIEIAPRGVPQIEVCFDYDRSGCLTVSATDLATGASRSLAIRKGEHLEEAGTGTAAPMDIMLLMDTSGSMSGTEIEEAKRASHLLVNKLIDFSRHRMGLISFNTNSKINMPLTTDQEALIREIDALKTNGGTIMEKALRKARRAMHDNDRKRVVILATDGDDFDKEATLGVARAMRRDGFRIITIGAGPKVVKEFLEEVAEEGDFHTVENMAGLASAFEEIINKLTLIN